MDEATLTTTLQSLASGASLPSSPAADARVRAFAIRRRRRQVAVASVVAVVAVAGGVVGVDRGVRRTSSVGGGNSTSLRWERQLTDPSGAFRATSSLDLVLNAQTGAVKTVLYWRGTSLCAAEVSTDAVTGATCVDRQPGRLPLLVNLVPVGGTAWAVAAGVSSVRVHAADGTDTTITPSGNPGWPYRVAFTDQKVVSLRALDASGKQVGDAVSGPYALTLAPVLADAPCAQTAVPAGFLSDGKGTCYELGSEISVLPTTAKAEDDGTMGNTLQVTLNDKDASWLAQLTTSLVSKPSPENQLAAVVGGRVLTALAVQAPITGGVLQLFGGADQWDAAYAQKLAAEIRG